MPDAPRTTQLYCDPSLTATRSSKKVSRLDGESGLTSPRTIYPSRYRPDRECLAACLAEAARGTERYIHTTTSIRRTQKPGEHMQKWTKRNEGPILYYRRPESRFGDKLLLI